MRIISTQIRLLFLSVILLTPSLTYAHPASVGHIHAVVHSPGNLSIVLIVAAVIVVFAGLAGGKALLKGYREDTGS